MKFLKVWLSCCLVLLGLAGTAQQNKTLNAIVLTDNGSPIAGASILLKKTGKGTSTNQDGKFTISYSASDTLIVSSLNYTSKQVHLHGQTNLQITLQEKSQQVDEVVVVGYGTQRKATLTGSVTQINADEINESKSPNIANSLAGRMPGLVVNNRSGEPGADGSSILIRGSGTTGNNAPLIVIDGVANRGGFERLNPTDIESITVLKDASAAIYGAQAANGVILVTTKRGSTGKPTINYAGSFGLSEPTRVPKLVNSYDYALFRNEKDIRQGQGNVTYTPEQIQKFKDQSDPISYPNTDWYSEVLKPLTPQTQHSLSISGGSEKIKYFVSGAYLYQDAFYKKSATNYNQYNLRSNIDAQITDNFKLGLDIVGRKEDRNNPPTGADGIFLSILGSYPGLAPFYPNGLPVAGIEGPNPLQMAQGYNGYLRKRNNSIQTTINGELKLPYVTKGLSLLGFAAFDFTFYNEKSFTKPFDLYRYNSTTDTYNNVRSLLLGDPSISQSYGDSNLKTFHLRLNYNRQFGQHDVSAFVAAEQSDYYNEGIFANRQGLVSSQIDQLFAFFYDVTRQSNGSTADQNARRNYFGRLNYAYANKYLAELVFRRDGSFNFPPGRQYGNFPGLSVGWRLSEEKFIKDNFSFVNELKLRASISRLGNDRINQYQFLTRYTVAQDHNRYYLGDGENPGYAPGLMPGVAPNPNITWEVEEMKNVALEGSLFNNKLDFSAEYFWAKRDHLLAKRNVSVPHTTGLQLPDENIGRVDRKGIELTLGTKGSIQDFKYFVNANMTRTWSKIVFIDESPNVLEWQKQQGYQLGSWLVYRTDGLFRTQEELDNTTAKLPGSQVGDIRYLDINNDGVINANDQERIYESPTPLLVYGLRMGGSYKNLSFSMLWQGQAKAKQIILPQANNGEFIPPQWLYEDRWTPENPNAKYPGAFDRTYNINNRASDFWLQDMSFFKLKTVEVGYTFSGEKLEKSGIKNLRLYLNGFNMFSFDKVKHYDPETVSYTGAYYPQTRIYTVGVNLSF
ncbi:MULTISPECIES: SusC/RagA family TonB-linked outer membrane protein [Sphingobacterium]|uniref:SusC/RagA family TonB-linked outer membrane protein n=1 Tax=Sphingobacterium TaxID=28453 RepID=UPI001053E2D5|nr:MULTISPECIES: TonB-dependent receptor [Sphingobacterium]MCW2262184.1 TonB-linked SusC/RagA family outer membrane protein [Sphingobacterium kitahiroshimense]TCR13068.1 TonB-linked SusC/RagA family outer membrane protein [Sphingobacterium sp. JUb78]